MENISKHLPIPKRELFYYRARQKNRVFASICAFFAQTAEDRKITKKALAEKIGCDPAQITRWLSAPSNLTLDTISDILLAMGAEMDHRIVRFDERPIPNEEHPMVRLNMNKCNSPAATDNPLPAEITINNISIPMPKAARTSKAGKIESRQPEMV